MTKANPVSRINPDQLKAAVKEVNEYFESLKKIYVGREAIIDKVKYAMLQKAHALFFCHPGTAKTAIAGSVFEGITGSTKFEVQMTAFMAEDGLFGPYNVKKIREEGVLEHNTHKMLPEANFANMDEFLDANPAVLRSLLSALNERKMVKGRQVLDIPLHLAYCSSNVDPYQFLKRNPQAWAVFDRIAFIDRIDYLQQPEDIAEMVKRFQYRMSNKTSLSLALETINSICDYILLPPTLIQDQLVYMKYAEAVIEYRAERRAVMLKIETDAANSDRPNDIDYKGMIFKEISDRRVCWASHQLEVNAVLDGRIAVLPEDMRSAHFVLGTSELEKNLWLKIVDKKIDEIKELKKNQLSELQVQQLQNLKGQFEDISGNGHDLETRVNGVSTLLLQLTAIKPENDTVRQVFDDLHKSVVDYKTKVAQELLTEKGLA